MVFFPDVEWISKCTDISREFEKTAKFAFQMNDMKLTLKNHILTLEKHPVNVKNNTFFF